MRHTLKKASALGAVVTERRFKLVYQPVVTLASGALHHHEVLVRFGEEESPFPMIRMAEELDLIEELDFAVFERSTEELDSNNKLQLAVNISGRTITSPDFIKQVTTLAKAKRAWNGRLMFELTESAQIDDLALADRHIQMLREHGCLVCLDDFGAGAASLAYLQQLRPRRGQDRRPLYPRTAARQARGHLHPPPGADVRRPRREDAGRDGRNHPDRGRGAPRRGRFRPGLSSTARPPRRLRRRSRPPSRRGRGPVAARRVGAVETWG